MDFKGNPFRYPSAFKGDPLGFQISRISSSYIYSQHPRCWGLIFLGHLQTFTHTHTHTSRSPALFSITQTHNTVHNKHYTHTHYISTQYTLHTPHTHTLQTLRTYTRHTTLQYTLQTLHTYSLQSTQQYTLGSGWYFRALRGPTGGG